MEIQDKNKVSTGHWALGTGGEEGSRGGGAGGTGGWKGHSQQAPDEEGVSKKKK